MKFADEPEKQDEKVDRIISSGPPSNKRNSIIKFFFLQEQNAKGAVKRLSGFFTEYETREREHGALLAPINEWERLLQ